MTVSYIANGGFAEKATTANDSLSVSFPATTTSGDMLFLFVAGRGTIGSSITVGCLCTTPSGWTLVNTGLGDDYGTNGTDWHWGTSVDTGCYRYYVYAKVADGTEGGTSVSVAVTDAAMLVGGITQFRKTTGSWANFSSLDPRVYTQFIKAYAPGRSGITASNWGGSDANFNSFAGLKSMEEGSGSGTVFATSQHLLSVMAGTRAVFFRVSRTTASTITFQNGASVDTSQGATISAVTKHFEGYSNLGPHLGMAVGSALVSNGPSPYVSVMTNTSIEESRRFDSTAVALTEVAASPFDVTFTDTWTIANPVTSDYSDSYNLLGQAASNYADSYNVYVVKTTGKGHAIRDDVNAIWYPSTGVDLWAMVDEDVASDADYIYATAVNSIAEMSIDSLQTPVNGATHTLRIRARTTTSNNVRITLKQGPSQVVASRDVTLTSTMTTYDFVLTAGEVANITNYDKLRVMLESL